MMTGVQQLLYVGENGAFQNSWDPQKIGNWKYQPQSHTIPVDRLGR